MFLNSFYNFQGATKLQPKIYFCVRHKYRREHNQLFEMLFIKINIHVGTWNLKSAWRKLIFLLISIIYFGSLFSRITKETHTDQSILQCFYSLWKERTHKLSKETAAKTFSLVCMLLVQLASMNVFTLLITGKHYFLQKCFAALSSYNGHDAAFFDSNALIEFCILQVISTMTVQY